MLFREWESIGGLMVTIYIKGGKIFLYEKNLKQDW